MEAQLRNIPVDPWAANGRYFKRLRVYPFFFLRGGGGGEGWLGLKKVSFYLKENREVGMYLIQIGKVF